MRLRGLCASAALLTLAAGPLHALRFYVNSDPAKGDDRRSVQSAQDSTTAFRTITQALRIAHLVTEGRPHVVVIPTGTYSPSRGETFPLVITQKDIFLEPQADVVFDAEGKSGFFRITAPTQDFLLKGMTFVNGRGEQGGVAFCQSCSLRVVDCVFADNNASQAGHLLYVANGRVKFFNNVVRNNGATSSPAALLELRNTSGDTLVRDQIRNNTFYRNSAVSIVSAGSRADINSNVFVSPDQPAIVDGDTATRTNPVVRYNLFWQTPVLYLSGRQDSIKVLRTVRDTLTLARLGVQVPSFVLNQPDTVAKAGTLYQYRIAVGDSATKVKRDSTLFFFNPLTLPTGADRSAISGNGMNLVSWTPALSDTNRRLEVRVEITDPVGNRQYLTYNIRVYSAASFPDTTRKGPTITVSLVPDTARAVSDLNALVPVYSTSSSAGGNLYKNPKFLNADFGRFELDPTSPASPAIDAGSPVVALQDKASDRNDIGRYGGPTNSGPPSPGAFAELKITNLPDSVATENQVYTYAPTIAQQVAIALVDFIQGPSGMRSSFGQVPPIRWTPTIADTGSYLVGARVYTNDTQGRHYFPLRVRAANEAPRITSTAPTLAYEDSLFTYAVVASDPNGDTLSYALSQAPQGMTITAQGAIRWTPTQAQVGTVQVEVQVSDGKLSTPQRFSLDVRNTNDPPQITSQADSLATEDQPYQYSVLATDPDPGDSLAYALTQAPTGMTISAQGAIRWTPTQLDIGRTLVAVRVRDRSGATATQSYALLVALVNDPPQFTSQPDSVATEDRLYRYEIAATDEEGGVLQYSLVTGPTGMRIDSTRVVRWTPTQADTGRHAVKVRVTDPGGLSAEQSYTLKVLAVNDPPAIVARVPADSVFTRAASGSLSFSVQATDEEGDSLRYAWRVNGASQTGARASGFTYSPVGDTRDTVLVLVSDGPDTVTTRWIVDGRRVARLVVPVDTVRFGEVAVGDTGRVRLVVANTGRADLQISSVQVGTLDFSYAFGRSPVGPADSTVLELRFLPGDRGLRRSTIGFATTDPDRSSVTIPLVGTGVVGTRVALDLDPAAGAQGRADTTAAAAQSLSVDTYATGAVGLLGYELLFGFDPARIRAVGFALDRPETSLLAAAQPQATVSAPTSGRVRVRVEGQAGAQAVSGAGFLGRLAVVADSSFAAPLETTVSLLEVVLRSAASSDTLHPSVQVQLRGASSLVGDFNGDSVVDLQDFFAFADHFGSRSTAPDWNPAFDLVPNGVVDFQDFFTFADSFGRRR